MNNRVSALISTISNTFCDFILDIAVNKYNMYKILFGTSVISFLLYVIYGVLVGFQVTYQSLIWIFLYGICILLGYIFYVLSLRRLPVGLTGLIESGSLFAVLFIDSIVGFLKITPYFLLLFSIFMLSIYLFSYDSLKFKDSVKNKKIRLSGIFILLLSMIFYGAEPYLIKIAHMNGANEISINVGYYILAIPYFGFMLKKNRTDDLKTEKQKFNIIKLIVLIAIFEAAYSLFGTIGYIGESPTINAVIHEIRVFLLIALSIIAKTDKLTIKKVIASVLGLASITGIIFY